MPEWLVFLPPFTSLTPDVLSLSCRFGVGSLEFMYIVAEMRFPNEFESKHRNKRSADITTDRRLLTGDENVYWILFIRNYIDTG